MKHYIVYDSSGLILRTGVCAEQDFNFQANNDELIMEGVANDSTQMIIDGAVCEKPELEKLTNEELILIIQPEIRARRNEKLIKSDWTQFPDSPLSDSKKSEWAIYRQALRDIPYVYADAISIDDIIWPTKPE
jgi:hypothetical protein